ncbi:MAG: signal peptidase I [Bulleidia sp.]|nr:signal peptidase I [Bulleidia sp.]
MGKTLKKILNVISTILVAIVVVLALLLVGARFIGLNVYTVLSGSMEPTYHVGSLIYVKDVDTDELKAGDVITYMLDEDTIVTHRIVDVIPDETDPSIIRFQTKGDANDSVDGSLVHYKNVIGTPVFSIPKLGYLANYIQKPPGRYIAISAGAIILLLVFLPDLFSDDDKSEKKKKKQNNGNNND